MKPEKQEQLKKVISDILEEALAQVAEELDECWDEIETLKTRVRRLETKDVKADKGFHVASPFTSEPKKERASELLPTGARARAPHCDEQILHAPGKCRYCDHYPDWQECRNLLHIAYTNGEVPEGWTPCPVHGKTYRRSKRPLAR